MDAVGLQDIEYSLKKVGLPYIQDNFPKQTILLDQIRKNANTTFINNKVYLPVRTSRHGGIVALASDKGKLVSGGATGDEAYEPVRTMTGTFDISKLALAISSTSKGAIKASLTQQIETLTSDFAKDKNRQVMSDGKGVVAKADGIGSEGATLTVQYGGGVVTVNGDVSPVAYLAVGQYIKIGSGNAVQITAIDESTNEVTLAANRSWSNEDSVVLCDGDGNVSVEMEGVFSAMDSDASYAGLTRATTPFWTVGYSNSDSEEFPFDKVKRAYLQARRSANPKDRYAIFMNTTLYEKYGSHLEADKRFTGEQELLGGWMGLSFAAGAGKVGVFEDIDVPDGRIYILNLDQFTVAEVGAPDWAEEGGSLIRRPDYLTYQATLYWFAQFLCKAPAAQAYLDGKTA